jgi:kynurenine 3-monooxygenase
MGRQKPLRDKVVVVGEGLVGSLLAAILARKGLSVEVFERRADMRKEKVSAGRSINLALSTRGLHALAELGLDRKVLTQAIPMFRRVMHAQSGALSFQPYGKDDSEHINSISRAWLNAVLMDEAEKSPAVRINFKRKAVGADFSKGILHVENTDTGTIEEIAAEVVIGADGSGSAIRQELAARPGYDSSSQSLKHGYKELCLPARAGEGDARFQLEKNALHIWPRGTYMLIALPNWDGSFTCTLFLPFEGPLSFESLDSPEAVMDFFRIQFPDAVPLIPDLTEQFFANPVGAMTMVKCFPWSVGGRALILGDAAHAMVPFYGQGMNCGFEDCSVLSALIDKRLSDTRDWESVFTEFERERKPDADAIAEMALENFVEMRDKVADPRFLLEKKVERLLAERFSGEYVPRYSLVTFSRVPYRFAQRAGAVQNRILAELCRDLKRAEDVDWNKARALIDRERGELLMETLQR